MNMLSNLLLFLILAIMVGTSLVAWRLWRLGKNFLVTFVTPVAEGQPSPFAAAVDATSTIVARSVVAQAKTTLMGMSSGVARAEKGLQGDVAVDVLGQSPWGGLLSSFPLVRKTLRRNPQLLDLALGAISKMGPKGASPGDSGQSPKFQL